MFLLSQIILVLMSAVLPLLAILVYCYVQEGGWKPALKGVVVMVLALLLSRMLLPAFFFNQEWFQNLLADTGSFAIAYSATFAVSILILTFLFYGRSFKRERTSHALILGFVEGFSYEAVFIGFIALNSLFSGEQAAGSVGNLWLAMIEAVAMMILFAFFAFQLQKGLRVNHYWIIPVVLIEMFLLIYVGSAWTSIWNLPRIVEELILIVLSIAAVYGISRSFNWKYLLKDEEAQPIEED